MKNKCAWSGEHYASFSTHVLDFGDGYISCPGCGKVLKRRRGIGGGAVYSMIPCHNEELKTTSLRAVPGKELICTQ